MLQGINEEIIRCPAGFYEERNALLLTLKKQIRLRPKPSKIQAFTNFSHFDSIFAKIFLDPNVGDKCSFVTENCYNNPNRFFFTNFDFSTHIPEQFS